MILANGLHASRGGEVQDTERFSAATAKSETEKGTPVEPHAGAIHDPNPDSTGVAGGNRERMVAEHDIVTQTRRLGEAFAEFE